MTKKDSIKKIQTPTLLSSNKPAHSFNELLSAIGTTYDAYLKSLTPKLKLIDSFLVFLVLLGVLQFIYVLLIGNFPFNAFLGGFISCVGQFVLTVSLRLQINLQNNDANNDSISEAGEKGLEAKRNDIASDVAEEEDGQEKPFKFISPERSFGDYIFASLILHFVVYHFIN